MRLDQMIADMANRLAEVGIETARLDARLLACHGLGLSETDLILQFDRALDGSDLKTLEELLQRRLTREPIAHILGEREFWGLPFKVTPDTLVPRPDSETLVAGILEQVTDLHADLKLVDIGTGSGCLLLSLLSELPNAFGVGVDISEAAIKVAKHNADALGLAERSAFVCGDYGSALCEGADILLSNPPYLAMDEMADLEPDVANYDPLNALVSGDSGLEAYDAIFKTLASWQSKPRIMAFEFGYRQAKAVTNLAQKHGLIDGVGRNWTILKDLSDHERVLILTKMSVF